MASTRELIVPARVAARFWDRVEITTIDKCWPWKASTRDNGYGSLGWGVGNNKTRTVLAHRVAYTLHHGAIPEGMTVDHICRVRRCCNPFHLRTLSLSENSSRNGWALRTECPQGHPYSRENTYVRPRGDRICRTCARAKAKERYYRSKEAPLTPKETQ